ncbi:TetR/AcrR family transcriptional regulator [Cystobacter fuscus]
MADQRLYRGSSAEERKAQRREQFIEAAIRVYGAQGYRHATVKAVCEAAGLTERYFYESFSNSEELLVASFQAVKDFLFGELEKAGAGSPGDALERTRTMLQAYYELLQGHPQSARVFLVEISGVSPAVDRALVAALEAFGELLSRTITPRTRGGAADDPAARGRGRRRAPHRLELDLERLYAADPRGRRRRPARVPRTQPWSREAGTWGGV